MYIDISLFFAGSHNVDVEMFFLFSRKQPIKFPQPCFHLVFCQVCSIVLYGACINNTSQGAMMSSDDLINFDLDNSPSELLDTCLY